MSNYRPYPKYKPSGVEWLGDVPEGWEHLPGRRIFEQRRDSALPLDEQLSATQKYGVLPQALFMEREDQKVVLALSGIGSFKHVEKDDFVISLRSFQGGIEHSAYSGCVSPAYTVLRSKRMHSPRYNAHLLKCPQYIAALQAGTDGIREGKSISYEQFGQITIPVPPLPEQHQIASFLDRECGKLDALQAKQERLIELLKEKRQALISHAVTKGLDPTAKLKPSGIEWLGEVPEHWLVPRLAYRCVRIGDGLHGTPQYVDESPYIFINGNNLGDGKISLKNSTRCVSEAEFKIHKVELNKSSLLMSINGTIGSLALYQGEKIILGKSAAYINCGKMLKRTYLFYFFQSPVTLEFLHQEVTGTTIFNLSLASIRKLAIPLPPLTEQRAIVAHLDEKCGKIDQLKAKAERGIELLKERRSALISAAVTGKIDVREM